MSAHAPRRARLAYLVSHPIQYQAPLLRRIAQEPDIDLTVFFASDFSLNNYRDDGFGVDIHWDVPLLEGYRHVFLPRLRDASSVQFARPLNHGILRALRAARADALWVHGYATLNALHGILAARALGIPVLLRAESWLGDRPRSPAKRAAKALFFAALRPLVDAVLPIGVRNAAYWRHSLGEDIPHFPMPYAVDNDAFQLRADAARPHRAALQAELNLDPACPVILFASKLQPRKRCADLIAAYALALRTQSPGPTPYLLIVGDGVERPALEAQAAATRHAAGIRFCGFRNQTQLPRFFDLASVFVLPSRHEPWGLIVNEVMNAARPVIVSNEVGCAPDLVPDGHTGYTFPAGDIPALAAALLRVLADPAAAQAMGQRARAHIAAWSFDQDVVGLRHALQALIPGFPAYPPALRQGPP